jgi:cell division protein FtsZ
MDSPRATIKAVGVGGGGCNAINWTVNQRVQGLETIAVNTDNQALLNAQATVKIRIGEKVTRGLGCGGDPAVGQLAAEESHDELQSALEGADIVFIAAGMGGGTGTGAAPVIAKIARDMGALTISIITKPFIFEGTRRRQIADTGASILKTCSDTLITIPNDKLLGLTDKKMTMRMAFALADDVLRAGIQGISDTITLPGLINLDLADIRSVMANAGTAFMAIGRAAGDERATNAARQAIRSPLLEVSLEGARTILLNITGSDYTLFEVNEVADIIQKTADPEADVVFGAVVDETMKGEMQVTLVATYLQDPTVRQEIAADPMSSGPRPGQLRAPGYVGPARTPEPPSSRA